MRRGPAPDRRVGAFVSAIRHVPDLGRGLVGRSIRRPVRANDLSGLPPAYITSAEFDPNRDEANDYAQRLLQAGVPVEVHQWPGTFHGSQAILSAEVSRRQIAELGAAAIMAEHGVNALPVLDARGRIAGIVRWIGVVLCHRRSVKRREPGGEVP